MQLSCKSTTTINDRFWRTVMADTTTKVHEHYDAGDFTQGIKSALETTAPEDQTLTIAQLATLEQLHIRPRYIRDG